MKKIKEIFNKNKKLFLAICILLLVLIIFGAIFLINNNNKQTYSKNRINNLELNESAKEKIKNTDLKEQILIDYLSDFMEQYNNAENNNEVIELSTKGKKFEIYMKNPDDNLTSTSEGRECMRFLLEFYQLSAINAEAQLKTLHYKWSFDFDNNNDTKQELIIDENYTKYLKDIKGQIDNLLKDYFK